MAQKFLTDIEITQGLIDSSGDLGLAGQVLASTGTGTNWTTNESNSTVVYQDGFTGDGSTVNFTLSVSVTDENVTQVYIDGVYQNKDTYSVSNNTLTFSTAPPLSADVEVITFSTATTADDLQAGSVIIPVKNTHTASISKGTPVYITGNVGASERLQIAPADASNSAKMPAVGLLLQTLAVNAEGYAITGGYLRNLTTDTIDSTSTTPNDTVYVKAGGGLTMTKPTGSNLIQNIAKIARSSGGNSGSLIVSSILRTNDIPNLTTGKIWVGDGNTTESTVVHLDESNNRLGINNNSPSYSLDVTGTANISGAITTNSTVDGRDVSVDGAKLDGIEANADVTDTANVTAAGALMDSEVTNLADVKAFDTTDYATAAQGVKADSAQQPPSEGAFVNGDKTKLDGIAAGAEVNVQSDWNSTSGDSLILNKPSIPSITGLASETYVDTAVSNLVDSAPGTLDTLNELAAALGDDANFSTTVTNSIATKLPLAGGTLTGTLTINNPASDKKIAFRRTGGKSISIEHDTSQIYFYNETDSSVLFTIANNANLTTTGSISVSGGNSGQWNTAYTYSQVGHLPLAGGTLTGGLTGTIATFNAGAGYPLQTSSSQRYGIQIRNTNNTVNTNYGWWWGTDTNFDMFFHADGASDRFTLTRQGEATAFASMSAPIYYDRNDTSYYLNPASTSISLNVAGRIQTSGTGTAAAPSLEINNPSSSTFIHSAEILGANMTAGQTNILVIGKEGTTKQAGYIGYNWAASGSNNNYVSIGQWSADHLFRVYGDQVLSTVTLRSTADMHAPVFYDKNNTSYYAHLDSTATSVKIAGGIETNAANGNVIIKHTVSEANSWLFQENAANWGLFWVNEGGASKAVTFGSYNTVGAEFVGFRQSSATNMINPSVWTGIDTSAHAAWLLSNYSGDFWTAGSQYSAVGMRAPVFYDSNDTSYYTNPASESKILKLWINNGGASGVGWSTGLNMGSGTNYWNLIQDVGTARQRNFGAGGYDWFSNGGTQLMDLDNNGSLFAAANMKSPIFYDSNDTGYYLDPNSTSNLNAVTIAGTLRVGGTTKFNVIPSWTNADSDQWPYLYWHRDTGNGWDEGLIKNSSSRGFFSKAGWGIHMSSSRAFHIFSSGWTANFGVEHGGNAFASGQMRAPIFYDYNNTAYYTDPSSSSRLYNIVVGDGTPDTTPDGTTFSNTIKSTGGSSRVVNFEGAGDSVSTWYTSGNKALGAIDQNINYMSFWQNLGSGWQEQFRIYRGYQQSLNSLRAPIFYDSNNTAYYTDPASTSVLNALQFNFTQHGSANNIRMGNSTTMNAISSGTNNAAFGVEALGNCSTGSRNFAYGYAALYNLSSGGSNIAMGDATGYNVTSGSNNLLFGQNAGRTGYQSPYQSIAGITSGSNQIHMGNESHTTARIQISWTVNSDARDKTDVNPLDLGLEFVKQLNPVTYRWDKRSDYEDRTPDGTNKLPELTLGFLAQEVEVIEKSFGYDVADKTNLVVDRIVDQDHYGITYEKMVPILTKAIQELEARVKELENN